MITKKKKNTLKNLIRRKKFLKTELSNLITKSIFQNKNTKPLIRLFIFQKKNIFNKKQNYISYQNNSCLLSGKQKTTTKYSTLSRHITKKLIEFGDMQNLKNKTI